MTITTNNNTSLIMRLEMERKHAINSIDSLETRVNNNEFNDCDPKRGNCKKRAIATIDQLYARVSEITDQLDTLQ